MRYLLVIKRRENDVMEKSVFPNLSRRATCPSGTAVKPITFSAFFILLSNMLRGKRAHDILLDGL